MVKELFALKNIYEWKGIISVNVDYNKMDELLNEYHELELDRDIRSFVSWLNDKGFEANLVRIHSMYL